MFRLLKLVYLSIVLILSTPLSAQDSGYSRKDGQVLFLNEIIEQADFKTFKVLGHGYAKDKSNVYFMGDVLRFVDPVSFKLKGTKTSASQDNKETGYYKTPDEVFYNGKKVKGLFTVKAFKDLGDGYGIDSFNAYYKGIQIQGSHASGFKNLGNGYAKDSFNTYYLGKKVD